MGKALEKFIEEHKKEIIGFTQELVQTKSVHGNETDVSLVIQRKLNSFGIKSKLVGKKRQRMSLLSATGKGKRKLIFNGHLDTVPEGDLEKWEHDPFEAKIVGGKMFGRGSYDMKAGLAAVTYAFIALKETGEEMNGKLLLALNSHEEAGNNAGIKNLFKYGLTGDHCIIAEPHYKDIGIGSRGIYRIELTTYGTPVHSGSLKKKGINAITKMARVLTELDKIEFSFKPVEGFPPPRINAANMIVGGIGMNVIPDSCKAVVETRLSYGQTKQSVSREIQSVLRKLEKEDPELKWSIKELGFSPAVYLEPKNILVKLLQKNAQRFLGFTPLPYVSGGATDGNFLTQQGIKCAFFGANGAQAHEPNEFVYIDSIIAATKVLAYCARDYLK